MITTAANNRQASRFAQVTPHTRRGLYSDQRGSAWNPREVPSRASSEIKLTTRDLRDLFLASDELECGEQASGSDELLAGLFSNFS